MKKKNKIIRIPHFSSPAELLGSCLGDAELNFVEIRPESRIKNVAIGSMAVLFIIILAAALLN